MGGMVLVVFVFVWFEIDKDTDKVSDDSENKENNDDDEEEEVLSYNSDMEDSDMEDIIDPEFENIESSFIGLHGEVYKSMLKGRIGCRPDMKAEFEELADY